MARATPPRGRQEKRSPSDEKGKVRRKARKSQGGSRSLAVFKLLGQCKEGGDGLEQGPFNVKGTLHYDSRKKGGGKLEIFIHRLKRAVSPR